MFNIRDGKKEDLPTALALIRELAIYEKAEHELVNSVAMMEKDGFGVQPVFGFVVAEELGGEIFGMSLYYYRYSTWKGKRLYLEDLIVKEAKRGCGAGKRLFERTVEIAKATECTGMTWQVLDWNEPAINFYKKYNSRVEAGWLNCNLEL